jgi:thiosulfate dehydrogenase
LSHWPVWDFSRSRAARERTSSRRPTSIAGPRSSSKSRRQLWTSPALGTNGVVCAQCHPNAANTHPETYPKFQKQLGRAGALWEMIDWCIRNPLQGTALAADDPRMIALQTYAAKERRGVALEPGKR